MTIEELFEEVGEEIEVDLPELMCDLFLDLEALSEGTCSDKENVLSIAQDLEDRIKKVNKTIRENLK